MSLSFLRFRIQSAAAFCVVAFYGSVVSGAELDITLQKVVDAPLQVDYEGLLTTQSYTDSENPVRNTHRITHQKPDRNRFEVVTEGSDVEQTVIQIGNDVFRREIHGNGESYAHRRITGETGLELGLGFSSLDLLATNYELIIQGHDEFLSRPAVILTLQPNHPGRISKTAWVDESTGLVLRTEDRDGYGTLIEETFFSSITIDPEIQESVFRTDAWADRAIEENEVIACGTMQEVEEQAGFPLAAPVYMPAGFTLDRLRVILYANQPTAHFTYTDGLSKISVYQRVAARSDSAALAWPGGTPDVQNDIQVWDRGAHSYILRSSDELRLFTLVSEISEDESINMIRSLCVVNPPESNSHTASIDFLWFAGGGLMVGSIVLGSWFIRRRNTIL